LAQKIEFECVVGFGAKKIAASQYGLPTSANQPFPAEPAKTSHYYSFRHPVHPASQIKGIRTG